MSAVQPRLRTAVRENVLACPSVTWVTTTASGTRMNECFFCGPTENPLTEEHVWPQWVSRLLFGKYDSNHFVNIRSQATTPRVCGGHAILR